MLCRPPRDVVLYLIGVTVERLDGLVGPEPANVDALVGGAGRETLVRLPVDVQRRGRVEGELLLVMAGLRVPDDGRAIDAWKKIKTGFEPGTLTLTTSENASRKIFLFLEMLISSKPY